MSGNATIFLRSIPTSKFCPRGIVCSPQNSD